MSRETTMGDLQWEEQAENFDFFGEAALNNDVDPLEEIQDELEKDDTLTPEQKEEKAKKKEEELADGLFKMTDPDEDEDDGLGNEDEDEEEEDSTNKGKAPKGDKKTTAAKLSPKQTLEFLKEKGLVNFELEENQELTDDMANDILEDSYEDAIQEAAMETVKELSPQLKQLMKLELQGGDVNQLLATMAKQTVSGLSKTTDMTVESNQILAVTQDLLDQGHDNEYIQTQIDFLKDSGKLEAIATKSFTKITAKQEKEVADQLAAATLRAETEKKNAREYKANVAKKIGEIKELKGLPITKKIKDSLPAFMSDKTVELKNGAIITPMQEAYFKAMADPEKSLLLGALLFNDFDFTSLKAAGVTAFSQEARRNIQEAPGSGAAKGSSRKPNKSLAELLD